MGLAAHDDEEEERTVLSTAAKRDFRLGKELPLATYIGCTKVHFTAEQEAQLARVAIKSGTDAPHLVKDAALRLLEEDARFRAAVREGIA